MKHRPDTPGGVTKLRMLTEEELILWIGESPQSMRNMTIYPETLTPERRLSQIKQELPGLAHDASEENKPEVY